MFTFTPKTEDELNPLLPKNTYPIEIINMEQKISQTGNPYILVTVRAYDNHGKPRIVYDRLMPTVEYKLKHICDATGNESIYQKGQFSDEDLDKFKNKACYAKIYTQIDKSGKYPDKNAIADYLLDPEGKKTLYKTISSNGKLVDEKPIVSMKDFEDDKDIPF